MVRSVSSPHALLCVEVVVLRVGGGLQGPVAQRASTLQGSQPFMAPIATQGQLMSEVL